MRQAAFYLAATALLAGCSGGSSAGGPPGGADAGSGATADLRPCTPVAEATETVHASDDYGAMEGTLEVPAGCAGATVVLILSGSGPQDRDGNTPGSLARTDVYKLLAAGLRAAGVPSLRFDDPGVARSAPALPADESKILYEMEVEAARRWLPLLHADARFARVAVAGHSQGALTALLLAEGSGVDAVLSLEGAGRPIDVVLREQLAPQLTPAQLARLDAALAMLKAGKLAGPQQPPLDQLLRVSVQPYLISWMKYDPAAEIARVKQPTLVVQGGTDVQVSLDDAAALVAARPDAGELLVDDMCHMLKQADERDAASQVPQYSDPSLPLHPKLVPALVAFLAARAGL